MATPKRLPQTVRELLLANPVTSEMSRQAVKELIDAAPLRKGIPVRKSFVRRDSSQPPMSNLYRGGQSGIVAVRLYLALIWKSSAPPYATTESARAWATLLDLDDPGGLGQRRITRAVHALEARNLVAVSRTPGKVPEITLLDESGSGGAYETPSAEYTAATLEKDIDRQQQNWYFKIPTKLWADGEIQKMSGPGLIMLLILLAERADKGKGVWFGGDQFEKRYCISHKTRTDGTKELHKRSLLSIGREPVQTRPGAPMVFTPKRQRHVYKLRGAAVPAVEKKTSAPKKSSRRTKGTK